MRTILLLVAASLAFCAAMANCDWHWFGIDQSDQNYRAFLALSALAFALSFLPWDEWRAVSQRRRYR